MLEKETKSPEKSSVMNLEETELRLGLPGGNNRGKPSGAKRVFSETVTLDIGISSAADRERSKNSFDDAGNGSPEQDVSGSTSPPTAKAQVVGWPPVKSFRKSVAMKRSKYVKVAVDGAPYLRKVDLEMHSSYDQLLTALQKLFSNCFTICRYAINERFKIVDPANGVEYVPTYEDKDGDWMLVGDVPWKMFVETCKRLRLMKSSEAHGNLADPRTNSGCTSSSS